MMGCELQNQTLPLPSSSSEEMPANEYLMPPGPRFSMVDSMGMLRTLSMSGNLGMPGIGSPQLQWEERRPSGKVYDEYETKAMGSWFMEDLVTTQAA